MKLKDSENYLVLGTFLALTGGIAALILAGFAQLTAKPIAEAKLRKVNQALQEVLPAFDNTPSENTVVKTSPNGWEVTFYGALQGGELVGVAATASSPDGYGGKLTSLLALDPDGTVRTIQTGDQQRSAVLITEQTETPGLGTNVCERKNVKTIFNLFEDKSNAGLPPNRVLDQFAGKTATAAAPWKVEKDGGEMIYITGATVTSRAVTELVYQIAVTYDRDRDAINAPLQKGNRH